MIIDARTAGDMTGFYQPYSISAALPQIEPGASVIITGAVDRFGKPVGLKVVQTLILRRFPGHKTRFVNRETLEVTNGA
jgi:hypothetical protein